MNSAIRKIPAYDWIKRLSAMADRIYALPNESSRLTSMEGLRAYAAFLVFLVHYFDMFARNILAIDPNTVRLGEAQDIITGVVIYLFASHYGVDIFFFLSGLLICRIIVRSDFSYSSFTKYRLLRVYPTFLVSFLVWLYIRTVLQNHPFEVSQFLGNLFFLNAVPTAGVQPYNAVTWSLFYEFVFYLTFPLILLIYTRTEQLGPWHVLCFGLLFMVVILSLEPSFIRFMMFFGGALMASFNRKQLTALAKHTPDIIVLLAYFASTLLFAHQLSYTYFIPVFLVTSFLLILNILYGDGFLSKIFQFKWLRYMGNISYSFYLMHGLAIELIMVNLAPIFTGMGKIMYFTTTFFSALLLGIVLSTILFLLTEKPYFSRKRSRKYILKESQVAT
jgi:exopolysaccharide production protein ExoZ